MSSQTGDLYEFGPYRLAAAERLITRDGVALALTPKAFDLLLVLVQSQGGALTKKELFCALWPDTFVDEANLTFQISALRKALGEPGSGWIENIPKHGYRFRGPVNPQVPAGEPPPARGVETRLKWWGLAALAVLSSCALLFIPRQSTPVVAPAGTVPLTSFPGRELHPSFSPDGSQVAFTWNGPSADNFDIYVKLVGLGEPIRLTSDPAPEFAPAWSPDGRWIAFLRGPVDGTVGVWVIPALGGTARRITEVYQPYSIYIDRWGTPNANLAWTPDSKWLAVTAVRERRDRMIPVWLVSLETAEMRQLTQPPEDSIGDFGPRFSPDGRTLAFVRVRNLSVSGLHILPLGEQFSPAGQPRQITSGMLALGEPAWIPGTREVLISSGPPEGTRRLYRLAVDARGSTPSLLSIGEDATAISVSRNGRVVYSRSFTDSNLWVLDLLPAGASPKLFFASTRDDAEPAYSPDGTRIAFTSSRSGAREIWIVKADGSHPLQITNMGGALNDNPQWSPDGTEIAFFSRPTGATQLHAVDPATGRVRLIGKNAIDPRWSPDGKWIYFSSGGTGHHEVWRTGRDGAAAVQVTANERATAIKSPNRQNRYFAKLAPLGLWRRSASGEGDLQIAGDLSYSNNFTVAARGIYYMAARGPKATAVIRFYDFSTEAITDLIDTGKGWGFGVSVSPDGSKLLYSIVDSKGSDLILGEGIR